VQLTSYWYSPIAVCLLLYLLSLTAKFLSYKLKGPLATHLGLSLSVKLGGLLIEASMSKLKQPTHDSNKNRGGQAISVVIFATI
jgi:hypothetical protein